MNHPYSTLKAAWHADRVSAIRAGRPVAPVELQFILSDLCNHDCFFCAYRASNGLSSEQFGVARPDGTINHNPNRMIPTAKALELLSDAAEMGVRSVIFTGGGEPTVHPDHVPLFSYAMDMGMKVGLNTNGDLLRDGWDEVYPRMAYVRVSVDAGSDEEYARVRRVPAGRYMKVLHNLEMMASACRRTGCVVGAGYVLTPEGHETLYDGVLRLHDTGCSYVRIASMQSTDGPSSYTTEQYRECKEAIEWVKELETNSFKVVDLFDSALGRRMTDPRCGMQRFVLYIGANLKAYRCCYVAYTKHGEYADLSDRRLRDWIVSMEREESMAGFDARTCESCPLEQKNSVINYITDADPLHVDFV